MARTVVVVVAMAVLGCGAGDSRGRQRPTAAPLAPAPPAAPAADDEPAAGEPTAVELEQARRELAAMPPLSQVVIRTKLVSRGPDVGPPNVPPPDAPFALVKYAAAPAALHAYHEGPRRRQASPGDHLDHRR